MISLEQIRSYYPNMSTNFERMMVKEYLQHLILEAIFSQEKARELRFIGGTALRIVHNNERFSEDLDFDLLQMSFLDFEHMVHTMGDKLKNQGLSIELTAYQKGAWHCKVRFPELLSNLGLSPYTEEKILIQVDEEAQGHQYDPEIFLLNRFGIFSEIIHAPEDVLLSMKFKALFGRKRTKGRDFTDILFLLSKGTQPNYQLLNESLHIANSQDLIALLQQKAQDWNLNELYRDVQPFLLYPEKEQKRFQHFLALCTQQLAR